MNLPGIFRFAMTTAPLLKQRYKIFCKVFAAGATNDKNRV